ncbi:ROK family protein [Nonomuraea sp. SMC257]|uniref:ROK family protein n=1 Tax=Nonomuraea montanisoli TaxID=2741721 RepID=A0A7Y6I367_9ACTN|nr:ROK family protein [Nonomuraea montanisoli]NUW30862.1 ROK family protein [Nonomuraea montanisoli]
MNTSADPAAIGIDLGATHIRAAIVAADGTVSSVVRHALPADAAARRQAAANVALHLLARHPDRWIHAIGLAVAGTIADGVLTSSTNLGMQAVDYRSEIHAATGRATTVLNDAHAAATAEARLVDGARTATILMVTVGTGIGGGLVINGALHTGTGDAGEIGHVVVDPGGPSCGCGRRGCWEQVAGGLALDAAASDEARADPGGRIAAIAGDRHPGAADLARAAAEGDSAAMGVVARHAGLFAAGLDNVCAVVAPHVLILGGGIMARPGPIRDAYLAATRTLRWHQGDVRPANLGDNAGMIGAAQAAWDNSRCRAGG